MSSSTGDLLGLTLKYETPEWTEFDTGKTVLALHGMGKPLPKTDPRNMENYAGTCSIGFYVKNLEESFAKLKTRGVHFAMPPTQREGEGIKLALCLDPDGLVISIAEPVRQEPERPIEANAES